VDDFILSQKEAQEDSRTSDLQSRANLQVQVEAIVKNAVEQAATANHGLSKSARLRNVRSNREEERRRDCAAAVTKPAIGPARAVGNNGDGEGSPLGHGDTAEAYVPPPSPLQMLRKQRASKWSKND